MIAYDEDVAAVQSIDAVPIILETVCRITNMGFAAVARVTEERWIACSVRDDIAFGLQPGGELTLTSTICDQIRQSGEPVIISDVTNDAQYRDHHTPAIYGFRSYVSMPIVLADGRFFGTLCAIDPEPRDLHRIEVRDTFRLFAELIGQHLDIYDRLVASEGRLATEIETGELREEFIAVLGHDLRNPLASVQAGVTMLNKTPNPERSKLILGQMQGSIQRMGGMIDNILDFARGRLGGGISLDSRRLVDVAALAQQVVQELGSSHPGREIVLEGCNGPCMVDCDPRRIAQMLSNLIGNALTHGDARQRITVSCARQDGSLTLAVANGGETIPAAAHDKLFHPFFRAHVGQNREGLGLGLYIAAQIAQAHGGEIALSSEKHETRFIVTIPACAS
jgi:signal transduction histidine kinase